MRFAPATSAGCSTRGRERLEPEHRLPRQRHRALDHVLELADVAREAVRHQPIHHLVAGPLDRLAELARILLDEVIDEQRDVLAPLVQRRHRDLDHVQPVVEILAEAPGRHLVLQAPVRRADDAHVDALIVGVADAAEGLLLDQAQHLHLERERQLADLVEEERAAVGRLEQAGLVVQRAREGALHVAEQLGFEQHLRNRRAVHDHERPVVTLAARVDRARDHLLAGSALAADQHVRLAVGHLRDQLEDALHRRAVADDRAIALAVPQLAAQAPVLAREQLLLERLLDDEFGSRRP